MQWLFGEDLIHMKQSVFELLSKYVFFHFVNTDIYIICIVAGVNMIKDFHNVVLNFHLVAIVHFFVAVLKCFDLIFFIVECLLLS